MSPLPQHFLNELINLKFPPQNKTNTNRDETPARIQGLVPAATTESSWTIEVLVRLISLIQLRYRLNLLLLYSESLDQSHNSQLSEHVAGPREKLFFW